MAIKTNNPQRVDPIIAAWFKLLEKVLRQAAKAASKGEPEAREFLEIVCPGWQSRGK